MYNNTTYRLYSVTQLSPFSHTQLTLVLLACCNRAQRGVIPLPSTYCLSSVSFYGGRFSAAFSRLTDQILHSICGRQTILIPMCWNPDQP